MPQHTLSQKARDLSAYIYNAVNVSGQVEAIKMQKLMYYAKGWSLALQNDNLYPEKCEAWKHGPVIYNLYKLHPGEIILPDNWVERIKGKPENIKGFDQQIVDFVIKKYGAMSGWGLRNLTHTETPWIQAWEESKQGSTSHFIIEDKAIKKYFQSLISK